MKINILLVGRPCNLLQMIIFGPIIKRCNRCKSWLFDFNITYSTRISFFSSSPYSLNIQLIICLENYISWHQTVAWIFDLEAKATHITASIVLWKNTENWHYCQLNVVFLYINLALLLLLLPVGRSGRGLLIYSRTMPSIGRNKELHLSLRRGLCSLRWCT